MLATGGKIFIANALTCALLTIGCVLALKYSAAPFGWLGLAGFVFCLQLCVAFKHALLRNTALMAAFAILPLAIVEFFLVWQNPAITWATYEPSRSMFQLSDDLGYGPLISTKVHATRHHEESLLYDTWYSIDDHGLRITPDNSGSDSDKCLLFFGGSFTFGEGVADFESTPNRVAQYTRGEYRIFNFGFPGYGPHQMLSALERSLVKQVASSCKQVHAIYSGLTQHVGRAAGLAQWDVHGPKFILGENGSALNSGYFDTGQSRITRQWHKQIRKSRIYGKLFPLRVGGPYTQNEIDLYTAIVTSARLALETQFGADTKFTVVFWHPMFHERNTTAFDQILKAFRQRNVVPYIIDDQVLVGDDPLQYIISQYDEHPNAIAHENVADFLTQALELKIAPLVLEQTAAN